MVTQTIRTKIRPVYCRKVTIITVTKTKNIGPMDHKTEREREIERQMDRGGEEGERKRRK